jgi:hypothetical protein
MRLCVGLSVVLLAAFASSASAVLVTDNTTVALSGTTVAARPELAGPILEDVLLPYTITGGTGQIATGVIQNRVVRETSTGQLDFYYRFIPDARSNMLLTALRTSGFAGYSTDVDYRIDGLGSVGPDSAHAFGGAQTGFINFQFVNAPSATADSLFMFVHTTATSYALTGLTDMDSFPAGSPDYISNSVATFAPIPEPATLSLLALGGLLLARRRRA